MMTPEERERRMRRLQTLPLEDADMHRLILDPAATEALLTTLARLEHELRERAEHATSETERDVFATIARTYQLASRMVSELTCTVAEARLRGSI